MIKITNPLNKDGVLYEKGSILTLAIESEEELIKNGLAEAYINSSSKTNKDTVQMEDCLTQVDKAVEKKASSVKKKLK